MAEEMEDLETSRDTCEQTSRSNRLRTDIREISQAASNVRKSLQTCGLVNNREVHVYWRGTFKGSSRRKWNSDSLRRMNHSESLKFCNHISQDLRDRFGPREAQPIDVARREKWNSVLGEWIIFFLSSTVKAEKAWNFASTCHKIWEICLVLEKFSL